MMYRILEVSIFLAIYSRVYDVSYAMEESIRTERSFERKQYLCVNSINDTISQSDLVKDVKNTERIRADISNSREIRVISSSNKIEDISNAEGDRDRDRRTKIGDNSISKSREIRVISSSNRIAEDISNAEGDRELPLGCSSVGSENSFPKAILLSPDILPKLSARCVQEIIQLVDPKQSIKVASWKDKWQERYRNCVRNVSENKWLSRIKIPETIKRLVMSVIGGYALGRLMNSNIVKEAIDASATPWSRVEHSQRMCRSLFESTHLTESGLLHCNSLALQGYSPFRDIWHTDSILSLRTLLGSVAGQFLGFLIGPDLLGIPFLGMFLNLGMSYGLTHILMQDIISYPDFFPQDSWGRWIWDTVGKAATKDWIEESSWYQECSNTISYVFSGLFFLMRKTRKTKRSTINDVSPISFDALKKDPQANPMPVSK